MSQFKVTLAALILAASATAAARHPLRDFIVTTRKRISQKREEKEKSVEKEVGRKRKREKLYIRSPGW
jgi:hypothetical protein